MLAILVAVPVLVAAEGVLLVELEVGHHVGAVRSGGLKAGAIGVDGGIIRILKGLKQILFYEVGAGEVVRNVVVGALGGVGGDHNELILAGLEDTNVVPAVVGLERNEGADVGGAVALIGSAGCKVGVIELFAAESVADVLAVDGLIGQSDVLGKGIAVSVGIAGVAVPEGISVDVEVVEAAALLKVSSNGGAESGERGAALVEVLLRADDSKVTGIEGVGAAVKLSRIEELLIRIDVGISVDGGAVFPGSKLVELDLEGLGSLAGLDAVLADVIGGNVNRKLGGHLAGHGPAVEGGVDLEAVEAAGEIVEYGGIIVGLPGEGVPVQVGHTGGIVVEGVDFGVGIVLTGNAGIDVISNLAAAGLSQVSGYLALVEGGVLSGAEALGDVHFGLVSGLGGLSGLSGLSRLGGLSGLSRVSRGRRLGIGLRIGGLLAAGGKSNDQRKSQHEREDLCKFLAHFHFLQKYFYYTQTRITNYFVAFLTAAFCGSFTDFGKKPTIYAV